MANLVLGHVSPLSWTGFRDDVFGRLESEMDKFLTDMLNPKSIQRMKGDNYPKTDIFKAGNDLIFEMALPQVQKDNVKITLEDGILTVSGKANEIKESDKCEVLCKEIRRSAFTRSWQLPDRADLNVCAEDIVADFYDGLLRIRVIGAYDTVGKKSKAEEIKIK